MIASRATLQDLSYNYDEVGNLVTIEDRFAQPIQTQTFTYDILDRLRSAIASPPPFNYSEVYTYSLTTGNLIAKGNMAYTYNAQVTCQAGSRTIAHAVSAAGSNAYSYDCNGNMTQRVVGGSTYNLAYDTGNHLTQVTGAATATFVYDGDGKRVKSILGGTTTTFISNR